jgi:hypothetical protein
MKAVLRVVLPLLAVILVYQAGVAQAMTSMYASDEGTAAASDQKPATVSQPPCVENAICPENCRDSGCCGTCDCRWLYAEVEVQQMFGYSSFEFGTGGDPATAYAPLSKLDYSLDSTWTGIRLGVETCQWDIHFEWLTPMVQRIDGGMKDYDWNIADPRNDPTRLDSLSHSATRWNDGQKLEIEADYKYSDCILGMPLEVWPLAGFRWQRFDITAYNMTQLIGGGHIPGDGNIPDPGYSIAGDGLTFNQQYYIGYIGFQLRRCVQRECRPPINLMFQFDWGATAGYMVDHHLLRTDIPNFFTTESTGGDTVHLCLAGDIPLNCHWDAGLRADYYRIRTTGTITQYSNGQVISHGDDGVLVKSEQTDITAYLQYTF